MTGPFFYLCRYPIIRGLPWLISYCWESLLEGLGRAVVDYNYKTFTIRWIGGPRYTVTTDPAAVEYILKNRFDNFPKGEYLQSIMADLFGEGIFAIDGDKWVTTRKTASHMFAARSFRENIMVVFHRHGAGLLRVIGELADSGLPFDLQDVFLRFTLVSVSVVPSYLTFVTQTGSLLL